MIEKITAFVFGLLALVLEVLVSIANPTVESIVAAVFAAVIVIATGISIFRKEYITLSESLPKDNRANSKVLKLSNEIAPYIKEKDGRITLKIKK
jgi:hypothetical protein